MANMFGFSVQAQRVNEWTALVQLAGEMDMASTPRAKEVMNELLGQGVRHLIVNLHGIDYLDSTALGALVGTMRRAREQGGELHLVNPSNRVRRLFEITRLTSAFSIHATEEEAMAHADAP